MFPMKKKKKVQQLDKQTHSEEMQKRLTFLLCVFFFFFFFLFMLGYNIELLDFFSLCFLIGVNGSKSRKVIYVGKRSPEPNPKPIFERITYAFPFPFPVCMFVLSWHNTSSSKWPFWQCHFNGFSFSIDVLFKVYQNFGGNNQITHKIHIIIVTQTDP